MEKYVRSLRFSCGDAAHLRQTDGHVRTRKSEEPAGSSLFLVSMRQRAKLPLCAAGRTGNPAPVGNWEAAGDWKGRLPAAPLPAIMFQMLRFPFLPPIKIG